MSIAPTWFVCLFVCLKPVAKRLESIDVSKGIIAPSLFMEAKPLVMRQMSKYSLQDQHRLPSLLMSYRNTLDLCLFPVQSQELALVVWAFQSQLEQLENLEISRRIRSCSESIETFEMSKHPSINVALSEGTFTAFFPMFLRLAWIVLRVNYAGLANCWRAAAKEWLVAARG